MRRHNKKFSFRWTGKTEFTILSNLTPDGGGADKADFPALPVCIDGHTQHRDKLSKPEYRSEEDIHDAIAMVARPVGKKELLANPKAQASLDVDEEESFGTCFLLGNGKMFPEKLRRIRRFMSARSLRSVSTREATCLPTTPYGSSRVGPFSKGRTSRMKAVK